MLPFLKPKQSGSIMYQKAGKDGMESVEKEGEGHPGLMSAAEDLISAVHMKDAKAAMEAMKAHHEIMESLTDNPEASGEG
jgi:hypothetical protein